MDSVPVPGPQMPAVPPDLPSLVPVRISLYLREAQAATLKTACHELNLDMTTVVGMLIDLEGTQHRLRHEVKRRLRQPPTPTPATLP